MATTTTGASNKFGSIHDRKWHEKICKTYGLWVADRSLAVAGQEYAWRLASFWQRPQTLPQRYVAPEGIRIQRWPHLGHPGPYLPKTVQPIRTIFVKHDFYIEHVQAMCHTLEKPCETTLQLTDTFIPYWMWTTHQYYLTSFNIYPLTLMLDGYWMILLLSICSVYSSFWAWKGYQSHLAFDI